MLCACGGGCCSTEWCRFPCQFGFRVFCFSHLLCEWAYVQQTRSIGPNFFRTLFSSHRIVLHVIHVHSVWVTHLNVEKLSKTKCLCIVFIEIAARERPTWVSTNFCFLFRFCFVLRNTKKYSIDRSIRTDIHQMPIFKWPTNSNIGIAFKWPLSFGMRESGQMQQNARPTAIIQMFGERERECFACQTKINNTRKKRLKNTHTQPDNKTNRNKNTVLTFNENSGDALPSAVCVVWYLD